jgi:hypothetical protein
VCRPALERSAGLTSDGHPYSIFQRAIKNGNIVAADLAARELRGLNLTDALDLTAHAAAGLPRDGCSSTSTRQITSRSTTLESGRAQGFPIRRTRFGVC